MPYPTLTSPNDLLANPFAKNPFGTTNTGLITSNPSVFTTNGGQVTGVKTINPILELKPTTGSGLNFKKGQALKDFESTHKLKSKITSDKANENDSWWDKRTKKQKIGIIVGSVVATVTIVLLIRKVVK